MSGHKEITVNGKNVLTHLFQPEKLQRDRTVEVIPADLTPPPNFPGRFYLANIGSGEHPLLLELRFAPVPGGTFIALLMTNERYPRDIDSMAYQLVKKVIDRGIRFDAVIGPASLGSVLAQEIARNMGRYYPWTAIQKGKPQIGVDGHLFVGSPKPWIEPDAGIDINSGTSHEGTKQMLYLDQDVAAHFRNRRVLLVDDARLSGGTGLGSIRLMRHLGIEPAAYATVLNEAEPTDEVEGVPYIGLTKLPLFTGEKGFTPLPGTYEGLDYFYREV